MVLCFVLGDLEEASTILVVSCQQPTIHDDPGLV